MSRRETAALFEQQAQQPQRRLLQHDALAAQMDPAQFEIDHQIARAPAAHG